MLELEKYEDDEDKNVKKNRKPGMLPRSQHGRRWDGSAGMQQTFRLTRIISQLILCLHGGNKGQQNHSLYQSVSIKIQQLDMHIILISTA